jgi:hypothetical protein
MNISGMPMIANRRLLEHVSNGPSPAASESAIVAERTITRPNPVRISAVEAMRRNSPERPTTRPSETRAAKPAPAVSGGAAAILRWSVGCAPSWSWPPAPPSSLRGVSAESVLHGSRETRAAVGVGRELVEGCRGRSEEDHVSVTGDPRRQRDDVCHDVFSLSVVDLEERNGGRVSRERLDDPGPLDADHDRRLHGGPARGDEIADVDAFS